MVGFVNLYQMDVIRGKSTEGNMTREEFIKKKIKEKEMVLVVVLMIDKIQQIDVQRIQMMMICMMLLVERRRSIE